MSIEICGQCRGPVCGHGMCLNCQGCRECGNSGQSYYRDRYEDYVRDHGDPREDDEQLGSRVITETASTK